MTGRTNKRLARLAAVAAAVALALVASLAAVPGVARAVEQDIDGQYLHWDPQNGGTVEGKYNTVTQWGAKLTLEAKPAEDYMFEGWTVEGGGYDYGTRGFYADTEPRVSTIEGAQALADSYTAHFIDFRPRTAITSATLSVTPPMAGRNALGYGKFELVSTDPARAKRHIRILQETRAIDAGSVWYDENKELFTGEFVLGKTYYVKPYLRIEDTAAYDWESIQEVVVPGSSTVNRERRSVHTVQLIIAFDAVNPLPVTATAGGKAEAIPTGNEGEFALTATPDSGYEFIKWKVTGDVTVADPHAASTTATVTGGNASVEAVFERKSSPDPKPKPAAEVTMLRVYNPWSGEHLFTDSMAEVRALEALGWRYEGVAWVAPASSETPVWRLYNPFSGDHHYTTDRTEYLRLGAIDWKQEGVGFYSDDAKGLAVWRLFNPFVKVGTHHYTTGRPEYDALAGAGWVAEGVGWWALR